MPSLPTTLSGNQRITVSRSSHVSTDPILHPICHAYSLLSTNSPCKLMTQYQLQAMNFSSNIHIHSSIHESPSASVCGPKHQNQANVSFRCPILFSSTMSDLIFKSSFLIS